MNSATGNWDAEVPQQVTPALFIQPPAKAGVLPPEESGFHVQPQDFAWFRRSLARTDAAALSAFAGDGDTAARYLTNRQGRNYFTGYAHAAAGSVQDARQTLLDIPCVGTDHVYRLNRTRVEAFSGVARDLFEHLARGHIEAYRAQVYARRASYPQVAWDERWRGPVSIQQDGSALAIRLLRA